MNRAITALAAFVFCWPSVAAAINDPIRWTINARIIGVNGTPPDGALRDIGVDWNVNFVMTVAGTEPAPDGMIPGGEHRQRLILTDQFSIDFDAPGSADGFMFVDEGATIDGAYLPRNFDGEDSADYTFSDLPLQRSRGGGLETIDIVFGFFGEDGLLESDDDFISMPDLKSVLGTGFSIQFENGAFAFGELVEWNSVVIPAPGPAGLIGFGAVAALRRRGR